MNTDFHKASSHKDGYRNDCKDCVSKYQKANYQKRLGYRRKQTRIYHNRYKKDLLVFIRRMYSYMKARTKGHCLASSLYSGMEICDRKEFVLFAFSNWELKYLFHQWIMNDYSKRLLPTPDRIDESKGYLIDNIQFLSFSDNVKKRWLDGKWKK